ncbi:MAG: lipoyl(octanoyl) transferase LipB, partial [Gammaproteobacteria bacterium]|nr:lipoyl(octanoyl) transferase LipB [Gammaproteobacteria bacterium]
MTRPTSLHVKRFGLRDYQPIFELMQSWSAQRSSETTDQLWLLEHRPVYTQGRNGKPEHVLNPGNIPIVQVDRGGQVTYHGPGQLMVYLMLDVKRGGWGVRQIVSAMEQAVISLLEDYGVHAFADKNAPGVYVEQGKISALGLRVKNGCSYHGLSLNLDMDLAPFAGINPCGYAGLNVIRLIDLVDFQRQKLEDKL